MFRLEILEGAYCPYALRDIALLWLGRCWRPDVRVHDTCWCDNATGYCWGDGNWCIGVNHGPPFQVKHLLAITIALLPSAVFAEQFTPQQMIDEMTKSPENRDVRVHDAIGPVDYWINNRCVEFEC